LEDKIQSIPKTMEKFFCGSGSMGKPSADTVEVQLKKVQKGKLITLDQLREKLAKDFKVQAACPASTTKALVNLSKEEKPACYWRVVKKKGELISKYPNGFEGHAALLENEGFEIDFSNKTPVVVQYEKSLGKLT